MKPPESPEPCEHLSRALAVTATLLLVTVSLIAGMCGCAPLLAPAEAAGPDRTAEFEQTCRDVWRVELAREIDPGGLAGCLTQARAGRTKEEIAADVRTSEEWIAKHAPCPAGQVKQADFSCVPAQPTLPRIHVDGRLLRAGTDGPMFVWRGLTAFALLDHVADGRVAEAEAFMAASAADGFNLVRVLAMANGLFQLRPADGLRALPAFLARAAAHGLYVELVALADTAAYEMSADDLRAQVRAVGAIAATAPHALVQVANEHYHATQVRALHDPAVVEALGRELPDVVTWTASPAASDEAPVPQGEYVTRHLDRSRDTWNRTRRVRELELLSATAGKPVIDDEPIGAAEQDRSGSRSANPDEHLARAALARLMGTVGSTFHCDDCLYARPLGPLQRQAARAFIAGTHVVPDHVVLAFRNAGWTGPLESPVKSFSGAVRAYTGVSDALTVVVSIGVEPGFHLDLRDGWRESASVAERPGVCIVRLER